MADIPQAAVVVTVYFSYGIDGNGLRPPWWTGFQVSLFCMGTLSRVAEVKQKNRAG